MTDRKLLTDLNKKQELLEKIRIAFYVQMVMNEEAIVHEIRNICLEADKRRVFNSQANLRSSRYLGYIRCAAYLFQKYFYDAYGISYRPYDIDADIQMQLERQNRHMEIVREWDRQGTHLIALRNMLKSMIF